jgi:Lrp/AsnC family transcriptional regulator for asnA, asnC and gidA
MGSDHLTMSSTAPTPPTNGPSVSGPSTNGLLDNVNKAIVEELQKDGRRTYGSIAEAVGLSEAAVRQRVQKMRDAGVMQIVAVTDPLQVGFRSQAMVGIRADGDTRMVAERLAAVDDIDYVVMCTGSFDILVELVCEDEDAILELLNGVIRQIPGVRDTETFMYLRLTKQTYTWGTR